MHSVRTVDAALPRLRQSEAGSVVVVSSVSARRPMSVGPYGTVKSALNHYGKSLAVELAPEGIRAIAFLASPAASFISGTNLLVDGALTPSVQM